MADWREQKGPTTSSSPVPPGASRLPDPYHRKAIYTACINGEEVRVEMETELWYEPAPPATPTTSKIKNTQRSIHTRRDCPEDRRGEQVAWPGGVSFPWPLPPRPAPPAPDPFREEREIQAAFDRQWNDASPTPP